jgi:hypothetical protein
VRKALTLVVMTVAAMAPLAGGASAAKVQKEVRYVRLVVQSGFYVDNDPSGPSGGDLFGATGVLRHHDHQVGTFSDACTASSAQGGECQLTLIWNSGDRLQLAGEVHPQEVQNRMSITGGTGKYKKARGDAALTRLDDQGQAQRIKLRILR